MQGRRKASARHQTSAKCCAARCPKIVTPRRRETNRPDHVEACKVEVILPGRGIITVPLTCKALLREPTAPRRPPIFRRQPARIGAALVAPLPQATMLIYRHNHLEPRVHLPYRAAPDAGGRARISILSCFHVKYSLILCPNRLVPMK